MYIAPRYHTNQTFIMKGWVENGVEVSFLSQYVGRIEDYSWVKPVVIGYSGLFRLFEAFFVKVLRRNQANAADMKIKFGIPPVFKLFKTMKSVRPDAAILRERSNYTIVAYAVCKLLGIPAILYNQSPLWGKPEALDLSHRLVWKLTPEYRITPVSRLGERSGLVEDQKTYWVPFVMEAQQAPGDKTYFERERIHVLCIGKYQQRKNHQMMIEVIEELLPYYPLELTIVGEISSPFHEKYYGQVSDYVKDKHLEERVTFRVNLSQAEIYQEYRRADLFVLPSTDEPAAYSLLEAMAFSLPVISGSDNGTAHYINEGITGYIFRDQDKADLKDKVERIIERRENIAAMGAAAYQELLDKYQFIDYAKKIKEIMGLIKNKR